jgi:hypothetical protein
MSICRPVCPKIFLREQHQFPRKSERLFPFIPHIITKMIPFRSNCKYPVEGTEKIHVMVTETPDEMIYIHGILRYKKHIKTRFPKLRKSRYILRLTVARISTTRKIIMGLVYHYDRVIRQLIPFVRMLHKSPII